MPSCRNLQHIHDADELPQSYIERTQTSKSKHSPVSRLAICCFHGGDDSVSLSSPQSSRSSLFDHDLEDRSFLITAILSDTNLIILGCNNDVQNVWLIDSIDTIEQLIRLTHVILYPSK